MELVGAAHGVILNDPQLRQSLTRDSEHLHPSQPKRERNFRIRHRLALALHALASRIDPAIHTPEMRSGDAGGQTLMAVGELP
jgi:hypothetical protein